MCFILSLSKTVRDGIKYTGVDMWVVMLCPKTYFVWVLVLSKIYVHNIWNYYVILKNIVL